MSSIFLKACKPRVLKVPFNKSTFKSHFSLYIQTSSLPILVTFEHIPIFDERMGKCLVCKCLAAARRSDLEDFLNLVLSLQAKSALRF